MILWLLPAAIAGAAVVPVVALILRVAAEAAVVRAEIARMGELRAAVVDLRADAERMRISLRPHAPRP